MDGNGKEPMVFCIFKNYRFFSLREQRVKWCVMVVIRKNTVFRFPGIC